MTTIVSIILASKIGKTALFYFRENLRISPQLQSRKMKIRPQLTDINKTLCIITTQAYRMNTKLPRMTLSHNNICSPLCRRLSLVSSILYQHNRELSTGTHSICYIQHLLTPMSNIYLLSKDISLNVRFEILKLMRIRDKYLLNNMAGNDQTLSLSHFYQNHSQLSSKQQLQLFTMFGDLH